MGTGITEVPVEHRLLGLDRRTFAPALIALGVCLALIYGWQGLNAALPWRNPIAPGAVLDLGSGATAVPPVGWQLESGTLVGADSASATSLNIVLVHGGITVGLRGSPFTGTAADFLAQVERSEGVSPGQLGSTPATVTTAAGLVGLTRARSGPAGDQLDVAFKMALGTADQTDAAPALLLRVTAEPGQFEANADRIAALVASVSPGPGR